jgi:hypothetical protein
MNTLRRPIRHPAPEHRARNGAETRGQQDDRRLPVSQVPGPDNKGEHKADQVIIEEIEHIADDGGKDDLLLIERQLLLTFEQL